LRLGLCFDDKPLAILHLFQLALKLSPRIVYRLLPEDANIVVQE
jgi:hypothetical protein